MIALIFLAGAAYGALLAWACMLGYKDEARHWRGMYERQCEQSTYWFDRLMAESREGLERIRAAVNADDGDDL